MGLFQTHFCVGKYFTKRAAERYKKNRNLNFRALALPAVVSQIESGWCNSFVLVYIRSTDISVALRASEEVPSL
jgi:hypothetical protein